MVFSSLAYLIFLVVVIGLLCVLKQNTHKKALLLVASYWFYAQWDPRFVLLLAGLTVSTHLICHQMNLTDDPRKRRLWLTASLVVSLGTLGFFKYLDFFIGSANGLLGIHLALFTIVLPLAISFIVFEVISYAMDVYRKEKDVAESFWDLALLVAFFPHLISGPILKPKQFLPQSERIPRITWEDINIGGQQFLVGLMKKTLVADRVAPVVDELFYHPATYSSSTIWLGVISYSLQIYCDFSGYTDMAIGSARCLGFDLPQNFNLPYLAQNTTDFWRRWHISLSTWLQDYLYIPLGGNRKGRSRQYFNLFVVMLLGGLWHGASWNFVLWGGMHGIGLAVHKFYLDLGIKSRIPSMLSRALSITATYVFTITLWVPFRASSWDVTKTVLHRMYIPDSTLTHWLPAATLIAIPIMVFADVLAVRIRQGRCLDLTRFSGQFAMAMILLGLLFLAPEQSAPFIYFQF